MLDLNASRAWCAECMRTHASSFFLATRLLPAAKRSAIEAFYGLCRYADDLADEPGLERAERLDALENVRRELETIRQSTARSFPWSEAFADAVSRFDLEVDDAIVLVQGCTSDVGVVDIASFDELEAYSAAVAGTVGRVTMRVLGASDADSLARGTRLGIAMQLTNVLRDIDADARIGRNYIPYKQFPELPEIEVLQAIARRARMYYHEAGVLASRVPNDGSRFSIVLARSLYEGILDQIERRGFNWRLGRAYVPLRKKVGLAARSFLHAYAGLATIR